MEINERCQQLSIIHKQVVEWSKSETKDKVIYPGHPIYSEEVKKWISEFDSLELSDPNYINHIEDVKAKAVSKLTRDETLTRITGIIRAERFCNGAIATALENGELELLCKHLRDVTKQKSSTKLLLSDVLRNNDIDPKEVVLIRHVLNREHFNKCFTKGFIKEYTQIQGTNKTLLKNSKYWMVFISSIGTKAKFFCTYKLKGYSHISEHKMPEGFPCPDMYKEDSNLYQLEECDLFSDLKDRMIIEWGTSTQSWYQSATNNKQIVSIHSQEKIPFRGYEESIFTFEDLQNIIDDMGEGLYEEHWRTLSSVKGVYLIVDTTDGKQYIGSAYGDKGILGRWMSYVKTHHGGNKELIRLLDEAPERYKKFRFTILKIFSEGASDKEVIDAETLYKAKLGTNEFGLNDN